MTGKIKLVHSGGNSVSVAVPTNAPSASEVEFKLPQSDGSSGQALVTDASGNLSFASVAGGKILQVVQAVKTDAFSEQVGQGAESSQPFTASITPSSASNKVLIRVVASGAVSTTHGWAATLKKGSSDLFVGDADGNMHRVTTGSSGQNTSSLRNIVIEYLDSPNTTSSTTYGFTLSHGENGTLYLYLNRVDSTTNANYIFRSTSSITLMEVAA